MSRVIAGPPQSGVTRQSIGYNFLTLEMDRRVKPGDDAE